MRSMATRDLGQPLRVVPTSSRGQVPAATCLPFPDGSARSSSPTPREPNHGAGSRSTRRFARSGFGRPGYHIGPVQRRRSSSTQGRTASAGSTGEVVSEPSEEGIPAPRTRPSRWVEQRSITICIRQVIPSIASELVQRPAQHIVLVVELAITPCRDQSLESGTSTNQGAIPDSGSVGFDHERVRFDG